MSEKKVIKSKIKVPKKKEVNKKIIKSKPLISSKKKQTNNKKKIKDQRWYDKRLLSILGFLKNIKKIFSNRIIQTGILILTLIIVFLLTFIIPKNTNDDKSEIVEPCIPEIRIVEKIKSETYIKYVKPALDPYVAKVEGQSVDKWARYYKLSKILVLAVIGHESEYNPLARSHKSAVGLMQLNPKAHKKRFKGIPREELYHIDKNIKYGCEILKECLDKENGNIYKALHRYLGLAATYKELNDYTTDVLNRMTVILNYKASITIEKKKNDEDENTEDE